MIQFGSKIELIDCHIPLWDCYKRRNFEFKKDENKVSIEKICIDTFLHT